MIGSFGIHHADNTLRHLVTEAHDVEVILKSVSLQWKIYSRSTAVLQVLHIFHIYLLLKSKQKNI